MTAAGHVLLASVFFQRQEDGSRKRYRRGEVVEGLTDAQVQRLTAIGAIGAPGEALAEETAPAGDDGGKPDPEATKPALVAWLKVNVVKPDGDEYSDKELNRLNKPQLWEMINSIDESDADDQGDDADGEDGDADNDDDEDADDSDSSDDDGSEN